MKTKPHILPTNKRHESDTRTPFPQIDQNYQTATLTGGCGTPARFHGPSFREISHEYFKDEAPRNFVLEAAFFTAIILTVAVPILNNAQALAALLRSTSVL